MSAAPAIDSSVAQPHTSSASSTANAADTRHALQVVLVNVCAVLVNIDRRLRRYGYPENTTLFSTCSNLGLFGADLSYAYLGPMMDACKAAADLDGISWSAMANETIVEAIPRLKRLQQSLQTRITATRLAVK